MGVCSSLPQGLLPPIRLSVYSWPTSPLIAPLSTGTGGREVRVGREAGAWEGKGLAEGPTTGGDRVKSVTTATDWVRPQVHLAQAPVFCTDWEWRLKERAIGSDQGFSAGSLQHSRETPPGFPNSQPGRVLSRPVEEPSNGPVATGPEPGPGPHSCSTLPRVGHDSEGAAANSLTREVLIKSVLSNCQE